LGAGKRPRALNLITAFHECKTKKEDHYSNSVVMFYKKNKQINFTKAKLPITLSQLCNLRVGVHLHLHGLNRQWATDTAQLCGW